MAKQQVTCDYFGKHRVVCPHVVGYGSDGSELALVFQFSGSTRHGLSPGGEWRCFDLNHVEAVSAEKGEWHTGNSRNRPQNRIARVVTQFTY